MLSVAYESLQLVLHRCALTAVKNLGIALDVRLYDCDDKHRNLQTDSLFGFHPCLKVKYIITK